MAFFPCHLATLLRQQHTNVALLGISVICVSAPLWLSYLKRMITNEKIVTIFGGSKCREGDPEYSQALRVGELLADAGFTICTGGYAGGRGAGSPGGRESGGRGICVTMRQIKLGPN